MGSLETSGTWLETFEAFKESVPWTIHSRCLLAGISSIQQQLHAPDNALSLCDALPVCDCSRLRDMLLWDSLHSTSQRYLSREVCNNTFASWASPKEGRLNIAPQEPTRTDTLTTNHYNSEGFVFIALHFLSPCSRSLVWKSEPSKAPPVWKVRIVSCVPGSPMLCAAMVPLGWPIAASFPGVERSSPSNRRDGARLCLMSTYFTAITTQSPGSP